MPERSISRSAVRRAPRRVGIFGGTFDPPHLGHLVIAERARERLALERVLFVPTGVPPHKRARWLTPVEVRVAMTRLAVRGHPAFTVSTLEARRPGPSYTVDTLRALRRRWPRTRLFLIVGEDSLDEFHTWHEPEAILDLATLAVAPRPGSGAAPRPAGRRRVPAIRIESPRLAISSSELRERLASGRSVRYLVPDRVAAFLDSRRLYAARRRRLG